MSDALIDQIYKALRLLPEFDGNPNILTRFVNLSDQLVKQYLKNEPGYELSNLSLLNGILNKITGPAARTINSNGIPQTWNGIRSALINNFADHRDETSLYNDLALLTQGSSTPQEYYEKCQNLFSTIMTYISLHETIESTIEAKRTLYKKLTLQAYLRGLRDPLGSCIRCMRPETIEKALEFVHEELNILYMQRRNEQSPVVSGPLPMSGVIPYVANPLSIRQLHDWTKHGNPPPSNYFKTRELNFNDLYDQQDYYDDYGDHDTYYYYPDGYDCPGQTYFTTSDTQTNELVSTPVIAKESQDDKIVENEVFQTRPELKKAKIEINLQTQRQLPYIQIKSPPLRLLIDTGANQSFISPDAVRRYFPNIQCNYTPFEVTNIHATTKNDYSITLPCFSEFNEKNDITLFIYKFHDFFDGLIGYDLLENLESSIDLKNKILITRYSTNPLRMYDSRNCNLYEDIIPANSSKLLRLPINFHDNDVFVEDQFISNCLIRDCITSVKNSRGIVEVINPTRFDVVFSMDRPIDAKLYNIQCSNSDTNYENEREQQRCRTTEVLSRLRTDHLNPEERANLENLCAQYSDVFYVEGEPLSFTNKIKHSIRTKDEIPVYTKSYRYPFIHRQEVQEQISKMLQQEIIRPSLSAWSSPIWVVPKKPDASGKPKWRLVVDFRKLNEKTLDDKYPIPNINDVLDKLGKCHYFTTLDLASGFYQVEMNPEDIPKTAFNVEHGHYEYLRMPMGLKNSPSTFQRVMDNVLRDLQNVVCLVYLDDIIVFGVSLQEHMVNLEKVFKRLRESNFKIQMDKSEFLKLETAYLGHIISKDGIKPNPDKIEAIQKFPLPKNATEIKRFLGLLGYYRKFIPDFARITKPMTSCLKKGSKIILEDTKYINCFEKCKTLLMNDPILQYPDFDKDFILTTDASNFAIGAVLSQGAIGSDKPIAFASRTLNSTEINYSTIEKELLAIVWATKYFRPYLFGRKFKIVTDHKPLQWIMNLKEPGSRLTRWRLRLSEYDFTIMYKQGKANTNADALSRIEINNEDSSIVVNPTENPESLSGSNTATVGSSTLTADSNTCTADSSIGSVHTSAENPVLTIPITDFPLNKFSRQIRFEVVRDLKKRPIVTKPFDTYTRTVVQLSESNLENDVINAIKEHVNPRLKTALIIRPTSALYQIIPILQEKFRNSAMDLVFTKIELENINDYLKQQDIIKKYHEGKTNHRGISECYLALSSKYFWPKMKDCIAKFINECSICGQAKYDRHPIRQRFNVVPPPSKPFEIVHLDLFTVQNEKYLTLIDAFSKYAQAYHLKDGTAPSIVEALLIFSTHHGFPLTVVTDQGTEFTNQIFSEFTRLHKIQHHKILAHTPNENGIVERFHSTILEHLRIIRLEKPNEPVINIMPYAVLGYNSSIHTFTKCRPLDLITGHFDPRDPLDIDLSTHLIQQYLLTHKEKLRKVYSIINDTSLSERTRLTENRNRNRESEKEYAVDDQIFIRNPLATRQKLAPRFTQDTVIADLPIHIYTKKKSRSCS